jgi:predicted aspartyl protease
MVRSDNADCVMTEPDMLLRRPAGMLAYLALLLLAGASVLLPLHAVAAPQSATATAIGNAGTENEDELTPLIVEGRGPRFVSPTTRDQIGRIWAPAYINGRGPFRLVLDSGASQSAVTAQLAHYLGYQLQGSTPMLMHGVTGFATVSTIRVDTLNVGDLTLDGPTLPIVPDAMGGADGILGTAGLLDKRIFIDFRHDKITITFSRDERAGFGFQTVPFHYMNGRLIVVNVYIGGVRAKAILDTGGQITVANLALRNVLALHNYHKKSTPNQIFGATKEMQEGELISTPAIELGPIRIQASQLTYVDAYIFKHWQLTDEPAVLIGMDALGQLDTLIIDFRRHELQLRTNDSR